MWQAPLPPLPPNKGREFLLDLAKYYRSLVEYHQKCATEAHLRLSYVEALLNESQPLEATLVQLEKEDNNLSLSNSIDSVSRQISSSKVTKDTVASHQNSLAQSIPSLIELQKLLELNRGKILHQDYIVRELCGSNGQEVSTFIELLLLQGEKKQWWVKVPDSPGCWTIDLSEIPDVMSKQSPSPSKKRNTAAKNKKKGGSKKGVPSQGRMKDYPTLTEAVGECLKAFYPKACNSRIVVDWLYPEGLSSIQTKEVREAITKVFSRGEGKTWERVEIGNYIWNSPEGSRE
jgi:hypothetical protein